MRAGAPLVATMGLVLVTTACGGSPGGHPTGRKTLASALAYARCMRSHGVASYPDPKEVGGEIQISGSRSGMNPDSPAFRSAQQSCRNLLPGGGEPTRADRQRAIERMRETSRCMRAHGVSAFPDPTLFPPSDRSGYGDIMSNGVAWLAIPDSIDVGSAAFQRAAAACKLGLS